MALTDKLTNIANAIREKGGTTDKLTLDAMPTAIAAIETGGGGGDKVPNPLVYSGDCSYAFYKDNHNWILQNYGDRIQIKDITNAKNLFYDNKALEKYPPITQKEGSNTIPWDSVYSSTNAKEIGDITNWKASSYSSMFAYSRFLRYMPNFINPVSSVAATYNDTSGIFAECHSLREIEPNFMKVIGSTASSTSNILYYEMFENCYALNEVKKLPVCVGTSALTSNAFAYTFKGCYHLKGFTFATKEDGTPYTAQWKNQTMDFSQYIGWAGESSADKNITTNYNSGITAEDEDNDWSNNPNYWSRHAMNSRFNHDSAVELINSLPDTSAYIAAQNAANNVVKFRADAGSSTPGGSISRLTEEEVAVAAAKGWTIGYTV